MNKQQAKERIEQLKKEIDKIRYAYHVLDKQIVSDAVKDSLQHELQELEQQFPDLITPDSPTQRVGGKPLDKFQKVTHLNPMLSLVDAFSLEELKAWEERNLKLLPDKKINGGYFAELKLDGLAVSLIYEEGIFVQGATRGDGRVGEDVTQNLKTIESIPLKLVNWSPDKYPRRLEIRGEVIMTKRVFEELNQKYQKEGKPLLKNPRNAAAGSIRQLDPRLAAERRLDFIAWDLLGLDVQTHKETHQLLALFGFKTIKENRLCLNLDDVDDYQKEIEKKRDRLPFQIDGVVIVVNNNKLREQLGVVGKAPRGMIAYKFSPEETTTIIEDIQYQVGRTGIVTPVAILKPKVVAGSTVSRATLHNEDEMRKKDIRIGDTVIIHKAGDVIPEVSRVIKEMRTGKEKIPRFPSRCPACHGPLIREPDKAAYRCLNKNCYIIQRRRLEHFVSKAAFDIPGLGPKILSRFLEEGLIKDAVDLFYLKAGDIEPLERFAEKSASNIIQAVAEKKRIDLPRFIYALGIPNVGEETAYDLARAIQTKISHSPSHSLLQTLVHTRLEEWQKIPDVGPIVAQAIYNYFQDKNNQDFIKRLFAAGVKVDVKESKATTGPLAQKTFVFTGTLATLTREQAKQLVRQLGGDVSESVSSQTDFLVLGAEPGTKLAKARKLGVKIITEKEFQKLIKEKTSPQETKNPL